MCVLLSRDNRTCRLFAGLLSIGLFCSALPALTADEVRPKGVPANVLRRTPVVEVVERNKNSVVNIFSDTHRHF